MPHHPPVLLPLAAIPTAHVGVAVAALPIASGHLSIPRRRTAALSATHVVIALLTRKKPPRR
jgi:hypothetical protein